MTGMPERMGNFYLGKEVVEGVRTETPLCYDARDLTTHAVVLGMTGSGKTGLCVDLLEEAAIDRIPAIIIDPKGDITNRLLMFPDLKPKSFAPWVEPDTDPVATAERWRKGLSDWGQTPERVRLLKESAAVNIYTPGSDAGLPVSILSSLKAPALSWETDAESLREQISGTVSALLGLAGVEADPIRSREHILLANLFEHAWRKQEDLDLPRLILAIQNPPMETLGVFPLEQFYPAKDRFDLAMALNNILAAPGFQNWLDGAPLDIAAMLTDNGRPAHSIFYIAHLSESERMFFVTLLLESMVSWMRQQSGTTGLRALLYMDEIFGYFPPVQTPPSKRPLLTLLKQARAFGLGVVLATQNPVDLDYKGLTNAGSWFIGRLQAERDKERVLDGLTGAARSAGGALDRNTLSAEISRLGKRRFLLHSVHEQRPVIFETRWAMSFLRGPLTRDQIRRLAPKNVAAPAPVPPKPPVLKNARKKPVTTRPQVPSDIPQVFLPPHLPIAEGQDGAYSACLLGMCQVRYFDRTHQIESSERLACLLPAPAGAGIVRWEGASMVDLTLNDLHQHPIDEMPFHSLPASISSMKAIRKHEKSLRDHLYHSCRCRLLRNPALKLYARPGEGEVTFRERCELEARVKRDEEKDKLGARYGKRLERLETRLRREERELTEDEDEYNARKQQELLSAGESLLGFFLGSRSRRALSTASRKRRMTGRARDDIAESKEEIAELEEQIARLQTELEETCDDIQARWETVAGQIEPWDIKPRRTDVQIELLAIAWV